MVKQLSVCLIMLSVVLSSCSADNTENTPQSLDESSHIICYDIQNLKYLILIPNYFGTLYHAGTAYEDAIDQWSSMDYSQAKANLERVKDSIVHSDTLYYSDDLAIIYNTLGCLNMEMANYGVAYDYLIDAYISTKELYGSDETVDEEHRFIYRAPALSLCHYYYVTGEYEMGLRQIQEIRDDIELYNDEIKRIEYLRVFFLYELNDIEATIFFDRGEYANAYNLYKNNTELVLQLKESEDNQDNSFSSMLSIDLCTKLGDWFSCFPLEQEYAEACVKMYDQAIQLADSYSGDYADSIKSNVLAKKGHFLFNVENQKDNAVQCLQDAIDIQTVLAKDNKNLTPYYIRTTVVIAESIGFSLRDYDEAVYQYNAASDDSLSVNGYNHPDTITVYESMGRFYANRMNDTERSIEYFNKALEICRNLLIEDSKIAAGINLQLAGCYKIIGNNEQSNEYLEKAHEIYGKLGIRILQTDGTWK